MKRKITLSIALIWSLALVSLTSSDSTVNAEPPERYTFDTGLITLGEGQILRITVNGQSGDDTIAVRFRQLKYMQTICNGGICKQAISAQTISPIIPLTPNEGAFFDVFVGDISARSVRGVVVSNSRNVRVNVIIIEADTGRIISLNATDGIGIPLL